MKTYHACSHLPQLSSVSSTLAELGTIHPSTAESHASQLKMATLTPQLQTSPDRHEAAPHLWQRSEISPGGCRLACPTGPGRSQQWLWYMVSVSSGTGLRGSLLPC